MKIKQSRIEQSEPAEYVVEYLIYANKQFFLICIWHKHWNVGIYNKGSVWVENKQMRHSWHGPDPDQAKLH